MFKPEVKKITVSKIIVKSGFSAPIELEVDEDFSYFVDADGKKVKIASQKLIMIAENLKLYDKHLNFFCLEHGHYGAPKGGRQNTFCNTCRAKDSQKISDEGQEDDEG